MAGARQVAPGALVNRRGGRGAGVVAQPRPPGWRVPRLPAAITAKVDTGAPKLRERLTRLEAEREELELAIHELDDEGDDEGLRAAKKEKRALMARIDALEDRIAKMEELALHQPAAVKHAREVWRDWWDSTPSQAVLWESDRETLTWWIIEVYMRALYAPMAIVRPTVTGSMGQEVENPLFGIMAKATRDIEHTATVEGMTTQSRFRLAFQGGGAGGPEGDDDDDDDLDDYRNMFGGGEGA